VADNTKEKEEVLSQGCRYSHSTYGATYGPCVFNLAPSKLVYFNIGLNTSPEGWWNHTSYHVPSCNKHAYRWASFCWVIEEKVSFLIEFLSFSAPNVSLDAVHCQIIDHTGDPRAIGHGPKWESKFVDNIDGAFQFILDREFLKTAFFPNNEHEALTLNRYIAR